MDHRARNIAALPAALLFLLNHSLFPAPNRRPTMSANPSPPHISDSAARPEGEVRQNTAVVTTITPV